MKTLLNLLPEEEKGILQRRLRFRFLLWQVFLLLMLELFYVSILVGIYLILDVQAKNLEMMGAAEGSFYQEGRSLDQYERKFRETNERIAVVSQIDRNHLLFSEIFLLLDETLPEDVRLDRLSTKDYTVLLSGNAKTRDDLLLFEDRLKDLPCVAGVNVPISNLFSQKDVEFQVDFTLKQECLKKNGL